MKPGSPEKTIDLSQVIDKLYHILLYSSPWSRFALTTSVLIGIDCIGSCKSNYHTITATMKECFVDPTCVNWIFLYSKHTSCSQGCLTLTGFSIFYIAKPAKSIYFNIYCVFSLLCEDHMTKICLFLLVYNSIWFEYCNLIGWSAWRKSWSYTMYLTTWVGIVTSTTYYFANDKFK
jgi:hypothetical protein